MEGIDQLILAKSTEWADYRKRIRGICDAIASGEAEDDEPEALTIERVEHENPQKLEPLPYEQGLAVSLKYEHGSQATMLLLLSTLLGGISLRPRSGQHRSHLLCLLLPSRSCP